MSRIARLFQLMAALRQMPPPVTAEQLGSALQVTPRTIYRDIEELRALGVIIDGAAGFGYTMVEDNTLPPQAFETEELEAVLLGLKEVRSRADGALAAAAERAFAKLRARLPDHQRAHLLDDVMASHRFRREPEVHVDEPALRDAIRREYRIAIDYTDGKGAETRREVDPLIVLYLDEVRGLVAYCHLRADFRFFRLDRMRALWVLDISFRPQRRPLLRQYLAALRAKGYAIDGDRSGDHAARRGDTGAGSSAQRTRVTSPPASSG